MAEGDVPFSLSENAGTFSSGTAKTGERPGSDEGTEP